MRSAAIAFVVAASALLMACCPSHYMKRGPHEIPQYVLVDPRPLQPPQIYLRWYVEAAYCAGAVGIPFGAVRWFSVAAITPRVIRAQRVTKPIGLYYEGDIYVTRSQMFNKRAIKHELLHFMGFTHNMTTIWRCQE